MDLKLELVPIPVTDVDRAIEFYRDRCGFGLDHDVRASPEFRVAQLTPPGSACSIAVGTGFLSTAPGSVQALHLVVDDIKAARKELVERGVDVADAQEMTAPGKPSVWYAAFTDPDGNGWTLQQMGS